MAETVFVKLMYQATGCYNLLCSGFVQTNNKIAIGAVITPMSSYNSKQFDIGLMVWKDPKHGHWWHEFGSGQLVGYWPAFLFSHLRSYARMVQFGGEVANSRSSGFHTTTQMGSDHSAAAGFGKASYFRNLQMVDWDNNFLLLTNLHLLADHPDCYDIRQGKSSAWGTYFYYGGPGEKPDHNGDSRRNRAQKESRNIQQSLELNSDNYTFLLEFDDPNSV